MPESFHALVQAGAERIAGVLELAEAELRLAALSGLSMVLLLIVMSAALVVAWGLVVACGLYLLAQTAFGWPLAAFGVAFAHMALAYYLWQVVVQLSRNLTLPELRRASWGVERERNEV